MIIIFSANCRTANFKNQYGFLTLTRSSIDKTSVRWGKNWKSDHPYFNNGTDTYCSKYAFGTMPVLEIDGTPIAQTMAILRYLGKELGYAPDDHLQQAKADAIGDECQDIVSKYLWQYFLETDPERKEKARKNWFENIVPRELVYFESILQCNGTGFFVGDKMTYADIAFFCTFNDYVAGGKAEVPAQFENCPMATSLYQRTLNEPNVAAHIKSRPDTIV